MKPIESKEEYQKYVDQKTPNSPILKTVLMHFGLVDLYVQLVKLFLNFANIDILMKQILMQLFLLYWFS